MSKEYKYRKFNLSEKNIQKLIISINNKIPTSFYLSKNVIMQDPIKGTSVKLLLSPKECEHVLNRKPFTYHLTKDKIENMKTKTTKTGGVLPAIIPAVIAGIGALGGLAGGAASIVSAVNQRKTDQEKNEIQKEHNKEIENILREGGGLYLTKLADGKGLYLTVR